MSQSIRRRRPDYRERAVVSIFENEPFPDRIDERASAPVSSRLSNPLLSE